MGVRLHIRSALAVVVLLVATLTWSSGGAGAAGITTHQWMARSAIDKVADPNLQALLQAHVDMVNAGAGFPDVGYVAGNTYGETAHWQRFIDHLIDGIRARPDCGDLTDPHGVCAPVIAFAFGAAAHGMGDQVWDWLFEPNSPDRNEYWTGVPTATNTGAETQMDLVAIGRYGVERTVSRVVPDIPLVLQALDDSGMSGVTASQFDLVPQLPLLWDVEKGWADAYLAEVEAAMPWMAAHLVTAPGGVDFAASAIAGYWSSLWGRLLGNQPVTRVSITYPAAGATDVPVTGWDRATFQPGTAPGRGGARNRIAAVLTSARPYTGSSGGVVSDQMPAGTMTITDLSTGAAVPIKDDYPRSVPYGSNAGEHIIDVQPAGNLIACRWYEVDVGATTPLVDSRGEPVAPYSWKFRTACATDTPPTVPTAPATTNPETLTSSTTVPGHGEIGGSGNDPIAATPIVATPTYTG